MRGAAGLPADLGSLGEGELMSRALATSLAVLIVGTGLALGQSQGTVGSGTPTPPSSVIRLGPTNRPAFGTTPADPAKPEQKDEAAKDSEEEKKNKEKKAAPEKKSNPPAAKKPAPTPKAGYRNLPAQGTIRPSSYQQPQTPNPSSPITLPGADVKPQPKIEEPAKLPPKAEPKPEPPMSDKPTPPAAPAASAEKTPEHEEHAPGQYPGYSTKYLEPILPWTKCGRRVCGTVYVDTPYIWLDAGFLLGWIKADKTQTLVTTGAFGSERPGVLGDPGTTVLYDGQQLQSEPYLGGRFNAGTWFDECQYCGMEGGYFFFAAQDRGFIAGANGFPGLPGLYVPFFNPLTGAEDAFVVAQSGNASGFISINSNTRLQGADGHLLFSFSRGMTWRVDALAGVRWLGLDDQLVIDENVRQFRTGNFNVPTDVGIEDSFTTRNDFVGGDFGFKTHLSHNCWSFDLLTRVAVGGNHSTFRGDGFTGVTFPGFPSVLTNGGRLIGPANLGIFANDRFSVVPEVGMTLGWQPKTWCKFTMGYNWVYWTDVVRAGAQVDRVVNPVGVPTSPQYKTDAVYEPQRPGVAFNRSDIWLQSVTFGMQFLF